jgi:hypothetical protein
MRTRIDGSTSMRLLINSLVVIESHNKKIGRQLYINQIYKTRGDV